MKLAIIGSRTFKNYSLLEETLDSFFFNEEWGYKITEIVSGGAKGADSLARKWVEEYGGKIVGCMYEPASIKLVEFLPDWDKYGKGAGFIRNEEIVKYADMVLCFWDGISRGTANSLSIAKRLKKPTFIFYF